jgi:hypothetical protein
MDIGDLVLITLREPREQLWGVLMRIDQAGVIIRCIDVRIFEEWARQLASEEDAQLGPTTLFFPSHRIERISLDEQVGAVPSMQARFNEIVGKDAKDLF